MVHSAASAPPPPPRDPRELGPPPPPPLRPAGPRLNSPHGVADQNHVARSGRDGTPGDADIIGQRHRRVLDNGHLITVPLEEVIDPFPAPGGVPAKKILVIVVAERMIWIDLPDVERVAENVSFCPKYHASPKTSASFSSVRCLRLVALTFVPR
jgi:hypothetical protein